VVHAGQAASVVQPAAKYPLADAGLRGGSRGAGPRRVPWGARRGRCWGRIIGEILAAALDGAGARSVAVPRPALVRDWCRGRCRPAVLGARVRRHGRGGDRARPARSVGASRIGPQCSARAGGRRPCAALAHRPVPSASPTDVTARPSRSRGRAATSRRPTSPPSTRGARQGSRAPWRRRVERRARRRGGTCPGPPQVRAFDDSEPDSHSCGPQRASSAAGTVVACGGPRPRQR
jgi:hypothetical protein